MKREDSTPSLFTILVVGGGIMVGLTAATAPKDSTRFQVAFFLTMGGAILVKPLLFLARRALWRRLTS